MLIKLIIIPLITLAIPFVYAQMANPSFEAVSRCFFVYAPITQLGRDMPHLQLFQFGQPRMGWIGGYTQANQNNASFKQVFESNLKENKRMAGEIETSLKQAIFTKNQRQFSNILSKAVDCDRTLGIERFRHSRLPSRQIRMTEISLHRSLVSVSLCRHCT